MRFDLPEPVAAALRRLEAAGFSAYVVGGCVRDTVLGGVPHDYDICASATPEETRRVFQGERTVDTGIRHGTLTVLLGGMPLEITTFRVDGAYSDGRHPDSVRFTSRVEEDLSRRDFTINAMAYAPSAGLVDPFGGQADCQKGVIRCVGDPAARFGEDALRILRALRFSARLGFPIEKMTARAIRDGREQLRHVSRERIAAELTGLLLGDQAACVLRQFPEVVAAVLPELAELTEGAAWEPTLRALAAAPKEIPVRWAAFLMRCGTEEAPAAAVAEQALKSLKMSTKTIDAATALVQWQNADLRPRALQETLTYTGPERLSQLLSLRQASRLAAERESPEEIARETEEARETLQKLLRENACYTLGQLAVNGRDLAAAGLKGQQIGETLRALLLKVARGQLPNERDALLAALQSAR